MMRSTAELPRDSAKGQSGGADARRRLLGLLQSNDTPRSFGNDPDWNKF